MALETRSEERIYGHYLDARPNCLPNDYYDPQDKQVKLAKSWGTSQVPWGSRPNLPNDYFDPQDRQVKLAKSWGTSQVPWGSRPNLPTC